MECKEVRILFISYSTYSDFWFDFRYYFRFNNLDIKVGSSNWKRVMIKLTDDRFNDVRNVLSIRKPRKLEHYNLRYLTDYPWQERLEMLQTYYTFIIGYGYDVTLMSHNL